MYTKSYASVPWVAMALRNVHSKDILFWAVNIIMLSSFITSSIGVDELLSSKKTQTLARNMTADQTACPLDFTVVDWKNTPPTGGYNGSSAESVCNDNCCLYVYSMIGYVMKPYIQQTSNLMLADSGEADACLQILENKFKEFALVPPNSIAQCGIKAEDLSVQKELCDGIQTENDFRRKAPVMWVNLYCNSTSPEVLNKSMEDCVSNCSSALHASYAALPNRFQNYDECQFLYVNYVWTVLNAPGYPITACVGTALLDFVRYEGGLTPYPQPSGSSGNGTPSLYKVGFAAGAAAIVVSVLLAVSMHVSRRLKRYTKEKELVEQQSNVVKQTVAGNTSIQWFSYDTIKMATSDFCPSNLIGKGGFGSVYKGDLVDGTEIAVKKFQNATGVFGNSFVPELEVISRVRHENLVVLRGCSIAYGMGDGHQLLLVYDYMPNGSLKDYLYDGNKPPLLWPERRKIAIGIAAGLAYLHDESKPAIIHRDVKAANILLDRNLNALVADFGLAKFKPEDITHFTTRVAGTLGYVAPEYALYGQLTNKTDVYSFGILLLELLSGRRALNMFLNSETLEHSLISHWAFDMLKNGRVNEIVDKKLMFRETGRQPSLGGRSSSSDQSVVDMEIETFIKIGLLCAHSRIRSRPTMAQALKMLKGEVPVLEIPDFPDVASVFEPPRDSNFSPRSRNSTSISKSDIRPILPLPFWKV